MTKSETEINLSNAAYEASIKLEKARTALRATIDNFDLDNANMTEEDGKFLAYNAESICNMLEIVDDYIFEANKQLGGAAV